MDDLKACRKCEEAKPLSMFHKNIKSKDGLQGRCKSCMSKDAKMRRARMSADERREYDKSHRDPAVQRKAEQARKARMKSNPELWEAQKAKWNAARRFRRATDERCRAEIALSIMSRKYGISKEECAVRQQSPCEICGVLKQPAPLNGGKHVRTRMNIDHDHKTGKLRGTLCDHCNRGLGLMDESVEKMECAIAYLRKYATV